MLPTITIESTRVVSMFDMELLLGAVVVLAIVAWMTVAHMRHHHRYRHR